MADILYDKLRGKTDSCVEELCEIILNQYGWEYDEKYHVYKKDLTFDYSPDFLETAIHRINLQSVNVKISIESQHKNKCGLKLFYEPVGRGIIRS